MSAQLVNVSGNRLLFRISGTLTVAENTALQREVIKVIEQHGNARFLILLEDFNGTEASSKWGDISFQAQYDPCIEKIAVVAEPQWHQAAALFTAKDFRRVPIEFFTTADLAKARAWLDS